MIKVKNYLNDLASYVKSEKDTIVQLEKDERYNPEYITKMKKESHERIQAKQEKYRAEIDEYIDNKVKAVPNVNVLNQEYQSVVTNVLTKLQMMGERITKDSLQEMVDPIIKREDKSTLEAIRAHIDDLQFDPVIKRQYLELVPVAESKRHQLLYAKQMIDKLMIGGTFEHAGNSNLSGVIGMTYLEQSGIFEL